MLLNASIKRRFNLLLAGALCFLATNFSSSIAGPPTLGSVAGNFASVADALGAFFMYVFFSVSFGFAVGALIKYKAHRDSPSNVPISAPIILVLLSIAFLLMALLLYFNPGSLSTSN